MDEEFVSLRKHGDGVLIHLGGIYPHELCVSVGTRDIERLGRFFVGLGKGRGGRRLKLKAGNGGDVFPFSVRALPGRRTLYFEYSYRNEELGGVSDSVTVYDGFTAEDMLRFGNELLSFEETGSATLYNK